MAMLSLFYKSIWYDSICDRCETYTLSFSLQQKASDDLLQLAGNPFANMFGTGQPAAAGQPAQMQNNMWMANGNGEHET